MEGHRKRMLQPIFQEYVSTSEDEFNDFRRSKYKLTSINENELKRRTKGKYACFEELG